MKKSRRRRQFKSRAKSRSKRTSADRQPLGFELLEARHLLATLLVNSTADTFDLTDSVVTLRDAIHAANTDTEVSPGGKSGSGADTITFDASVFRGGNASLIRLTAGELEITDTLKIEGSTGRDVTITGDANDDDITVGLNITDVAASFGGTANAADDLLDDNSRVLHFSAMTGDLTLEGLTVTGGRTTAVRSVGGGIRFDSNGDLSLTSSTVSGNSTLNSIARGGGISSSGAVSLTSSTVSGNSTSGNTSRGGGISVSFGDVSLTSSTVSGNSTAGDTSRGGGIYVSYGDVSLTSSTVSGNSTVGYLAEGGGISTISGDVNLTSSTVSGNTTSGNSAFGGGIHNALGDVTLNSSTLSDNSTSGDDADGGGIHTSSADVSLMSSTLSGNSTMGSSASGGGISTYFGNVNLTSSTLSENVAALGVGGGVNVVNVSGDHSLTIRNSIVAGNTDNGTAPDLLPDPEGTFFATHSLIGATDLTVGGTGNQIGTLAVPIDPLLGPLADNGGPTLTHALLPGSPAINAGDPSFTSPPDFDQRGSGFDRVFLGRLDIGAFELQTSLPAQGLVVSTTQDTVDGDFSIGQLSLREAIGFANDLAGSGADTITFDASVFTGGASSLIRLTAGELEITDTLTIDASTAMGVTITGDVSGDDLTDALQITNVSASGAARLDDNSRVLNFSGLTGDLSLEGLTVTGGRTTANNASASESTHSGGSIRFASSGLLSITNSTVSGNSTAGDFSNGGAIFAVGDVSVVSSTVSGNSTAGDRASGGGISTSFLGHVSLTDSTLSGNSTSGDFSTGGGIRTALGDVSLTSSTVSGNSTSGADADGGGIYVSSGDVSLTSSTLSGNSTSGAGADGGGIYASSGDVNLTSSTVSGNVAAAVGGGVFVPDRFSFFVPSFTIENSIIAGNTDDGTAPDFLPDPDNTLTVNHSLIGATDLTIGGTGNQIGTLAAPIDPMLGPLADNGGPTLTQALLPGSPAIDAGDPNAVAGVGDVPEFDQRGTGFDRVLQGGLDIGAFESLLDAVLLGDVNQDDSVNFLDIAPFISVLSSSGFQAEADVNQDGMVSFLDIAPFIGLLSSSGTSEALRLNLTVVDEATNPAAALNDASKTGFKHEFTVKGGAGLVASSTTASSEFPLQRGMGKLSFADLSPQKNDAISAESDTTHSGPTLLSTDAADAQQSVGVLDPLPLATPDLSALKVLLSSGSVGGNNQPETPLPNDADEFFLALAGGVTLAPTVDKVNDVLDERITIDLQEASAAIDEAFELFDV